MAKFFQNSGRNSVEMLVNRALEPEMTAKSPETPARRTQADVGGPAPLSSADFGASSRPLVYNGTMPGPTGDVASPSVMPYRNRKTIIRKVSTFNVILMLFAAAAASVLYISNIIAVDQLTREINTLQTQHRRMLNEQEILKAEINRLSSLEQINRKAAEELGLMNPKEPPVWLSIDPEKVREVEEALQKK